MQIAMIVNAFPELSEKFIINQIAGLIDKGISVDIYAAIESSKGIEHKLVQNYGLRERTTYARVPRSKYGRIVGLFKLFLSSFFSNPSRTLRALASRYGTVSRNGKTLYFLHAFAQKQYDIVHCHFGPNGLIGSFLKDCGIAKRLVVTFHGSDINTYPKRYGKAIYKTLYDRADAITAGTQFVKGKLIANGCPAEKIHIVPVGFPVSGLPEISYGERLKYTMLSVGRLVEVKGYRYAIEAFHSVKSKIPAAEYVIIGDGPDMKALKSLAEELGIASSVHFLGSLNDVDVAAWYQKASVFLLPSIVASDGAEEGQGLVLQEAQASGLPVISTRIGGIPEGVRDGETGFLVPQKDSKALADSVVKLLDDETLRARMGQAGMVFARSGYDSAMLAKKMIALYDRIVE